MINLISRKDVFYNSTVADNYISESQKSKYPELSDHINYLSADPVNFYDHLKPFRKKNKMLNDFAVLGYGDKYNPEYLTLRSKALIQFLGMMDITRLYLIDELKFDWAKFPYDYSPKREALKSIVNQATYNEAFELDIEDLSTILPWFHNSSRYSIPVIWLFSADYEMRLAMFLCDSANFHTDFLSKDREKMTSAASAAGLIMGGVEVCEM